MGWANTAAMDNSESKEKPVPPPKGGGKASGRKGHEPDWAAGLKQLYDSVVDEPLPDTFKNLLARLDENNK